MSEALLTAQEVMDELKISRECLKKMRHRGDIAYIKLSYNNIRYSREDLDRFKARRRVPSTDKPLSLVVSRRTG